MVNITTQQVWDEISKANFAVVGMVNQRAEARTAGVVIVTEGQTVYFATEPNAWKTRHIAANPHVSLTVPIPKRVPLLPMIKVPAATITFQGTATVLDAKHVSGQLLRRLTGGAKESDEALAAMAVVEVAPLGDFVTYGIGLRVDKMRDTTLARGRAPVA